METLVFVQSSLVSVDIVTLSSYNYYIHYLGLLVKIKYGDYALNALSG